MNTLSAKELQCRVTATDICFKWLQGCGISWITMPRNLKRRYVRLNTSEIGSSQKLTLVKLTTSVTTSAPSECGITDPKSSRISLEISVSLPPMLAERMMLMKTLTKTFTKANGVDLKLLWRPRMTYAQRELLITTNSVPSTQQAPCSAP